MDAKSLLIRLAYKSEILQLLRHNEDSFTNMFMSFVVNYTLRVELLKTISTSFPHRRMLVISKRLK